jgi:acyl-CoA thioesterase-2
MTTGKVERAAPAVSVDDVLAALELDRLGPGRYEGASVASEGPVVFGGQLIGQAILAAAAEEPDKRVKSVHTVFARVGSSDAPVTFAVDKLHGGRTMASSSITASQGERLLARSLLMLDAAEDDLVRHADEAPATAGPEGAALRPPMLGGWDVRFADDVDLSDPQAVGPPELRIWSRFATGRKEPAVARALLSWSTVPFLIGTAMRPHAGVGQALAHRGISTGVLSHTVTFHDEFLAGEWLLLAQRSNFTGGGRAFGSGEVFAEDGRLIATYAQESLLRARSGSAAGVL